MNSRITLPTDNIYKFYAIFGLTLLITCLLGIVINNSTTNEKLYELVKEYEQQSISANNNSKSALPEILEKRIQIQIENKKFLSFSLAFILAIAICLMIFGFRQWHSIIQPKQDEYFELQIAKLKQDLKFRIKRK